MHAVFFLHVWREVHGQSSHVAIPFFLALSAHKENFTPTHTLLFHQ